MGVENIFFRFVIYENNAKLTDLDETDLLSQLLQTLMTQPNSCNCEDSCSSLPEKSQEKI